MLPEIDSTLEPPHDSSMEGSIFDLDHTMQASVDEMIGAAVQGNRTEDLNRIRKAIDDERSRLRSPQEGINHLMSVLGEIRGVSTNDAYWDELNSPANKRLVWQSHLKAARVVLPLAAALLPVVNGLDEGESPKYPTSLADQFSVSLEQPPEGDLLANEALLHDASQPPVEIAYDVEAYEDRRINLIAFGIRQTESGGDYSLKTNYENQYGIPTGAYMFMTATWQQEAAKVNPEYAEQYPNASDAPAEVQDLVATNYLKWLYERYNANETLVVGSWHAGPGAMDRVLAGELSPEELVDGLFTDHTTADYIKKVQLTIQASADNLS
jgi:hypothetical protein